MKIYMMTDLEGVAGVVSFLSQTYPEGRYYDAAKQLLTEEINAAIEGLLKADVDDVLVVDGHGPGAVCFEQLHPAAKLLHGRPLAPIRSWDPIVREYDVCMMIGQHAMAGAAKGNLNHTQDSRAIDSIKLNGKPIGEIAQVALYQGAMGIPLIFLSGDQAACKEAESLVPGITTVCVKTGLGRNSAISVSAAQSRALIREGAELAINHHRDSPVVPLVWPGPFVIEKRFFQTDAADQCGALPDAQRLDDQTVRFESDDVQDIIYR